MAQEQGVSRTHFIPSMRSCCVLLDSLCFPSSLSSSFSFSWSSSSSMWEIRTCALLRMRSQALWPRTILSQIVQQTRGQKIRSIACNSEMDRAKDVEQFDDILRTFINEMNKFESRFGAIRDEEKIFAVKKLMPESLLNYRFRGTTISFSEILSRCWPPWSWWRRPSTCQDSNLTGKPGASETSLLRVAQGVP